MVSFFKHMAQYFKGSEAPKPKEPEVFAERHAYITEQQALSTPWAMFEVVGFEPNDQVKVEFNWNDAFIRKLDELGFTAETEEDTVQLFFMASQLRPTQLEAISGDESVPVEDLPQLSGRVNRVVR